MKSSTVVQTIIAVVSPETMECFDFEQSDTRPWKPPDHVLGSKITHDPKSLGSNTKTTLVFLESPASIRYSGRNTDP